MNDKKRIIDGLLKGNHMILLIVGSKFNLAVPFCKPLYGDTQLGILRWEIKV